MSSRSKPFDRSPSRVVGLAEVAERLCVTGFSLYAWKRQFGKGEVIRRVEQDQNAEVRRLKAEIRRVTEKRGILKKPPRTLPRGKGEVSFHARSRA